MNINNKMGVYFSAEWALINITTELTTIYPILSAFTNKHVTTNGKIIDQTNGNTSHVLILLPFLP